MAYTPQYDICIVGAGMIGSAAARHVTLIAPNLKVCLIGPKEPKDRTTCSHGIFGSHYDEGRIVTTLTTNSDPIRSEFARRSHTRYRDIEQRTGVKFYNEVGHVVMCKNGRPYIEKIKKISRTMNVKTQELDYSSLSIKYPYLSCQLHDVGILQSVGAGYINPRSQLRAQQTAAYLQGCDIVDDVVDQVTETNQSDSSRCMKVTTAKGQVIFARRVLLTTGAFTGFRDLLPQGKELDVELSGATLLYAEVSDEDAVKLRDMPCFTYKGNNTGNTFDYYIMPPIKYPNGKYYLKIGHRLHRTILHTATDVSEWFKSEGNKSVYDIATKQLFSHVKGVKAISTHGEGCVTTVTPTGQPYCDMVTPTLGITIGGNGVAARSGDEFGRMGARMIVAGCWDHDLPRDNFRVRFKTKSTILTSKL
ncbi:uncharacterized protein LOC144445969 [Glandiceps talaboti]